MKKLVLLSVLFCSFSLITAANKEEETSEEDVKAEGTYFSDDSVSTKSKIKAGIREGIVTALNAFGMPTYIAISPLEIAIKDNNLTKVKSLLKKNPKCAGLICKGRLPLHFAVSTSTNLEIIQTLVDAYPQSIKIKDDFGNIPLALAIRKTIPKPTTTQQNIYACFKYLLQKDTSLINIKLGKRENLSSNMTIYHLAAYSSDPYYLNALLKLSIEGIKKATTEGFLPLHFAAMVDNIEVINVLLKTYPEAIKIKTNRGNLPLHIAASTGYQEPIKVLLKAYPEAIKIKNNQGKTPLDRAKNDKIKAMLGAKVEVSFMDRIKATASEVKSTITGSASDSTLLHKAARNGDEATITKILKKDQKAAQVKDKNGNLPLHLAAAREDGKGAVIMLLKAYKKGAAIKNKNGQTPDYLATTEELKNLLMEAIW